MAGAPIRQRVEDFAAAVCAKDTDYAPNIASFDLDPPLRNAGTEHKRRAWQKVFATYMGSLAYELRNLNVTTDGELVFVHSLNHVQGKLAGGHDTDRWVRWTACFRRIDASGWSCTITCPSQPISRMAGPF